MSLVGPALRILAAVAVFAACNLAAAARAEPVVKGTRYFDSRQNRLRHISWSTAGLLLAYLIIAD